MHYNTSAFCFKDTRIKKIIHAIKYFHRKDLIVPLAKVLASEIEKRNTSASQCTRPTLVPIPMPTMRKYIRGYNQAELIAIELSKQCNYPIDTTILIKSHITKRQATVKSRSERLRNPKGSFSTHTNVTNMHIILVDDVITTGATLEEARKTLLRAGAKSVITATLAH